MTLVVGYIFKDWFKSPQTYEESFSFKKTTLDDFKFAILVTAPAIILHEFGHKIAAILFGLQAEFNAAYIWLGVGVLLKLLGTGFIFFVPAYISHSAAALPWQSAIIGFAGPAINLILWFLASYLLKTKPYLPHKHKVALILTKKINMFLFIFNMIPIPGFDGSHVLSGIMKTFF